MARHDITVRYRNSAFEYYGDFRHDGKNKIQKADHYDTISWMSPDGGLAITWKAGVPATYLNQPASGSLAPSAAAKSFTKPACLVGIQGDVSGTQYGYGVTLSLTAGGTVSDDPFIQFDDAGDVIIAGRKRKPAAKKKPRSRK
jgi:hypothetical protein